VGGGGGRVSSRRGEETKSQTERGWGQSPENESGRIHYCRQGEEGTWHKLTRKETRRVNHREQKWELRFFYPPAASVPLHCLLFVWPAWHPFLKSLPIIPPQYNSSLTRVKVYEIESRSNSERLAHRQNFLVFVFIELGEIPICPVSKTYLFSELSVFIQLCRGVTHDLRWPLNFYFSAMTNFIIFHFLMHYYPLKNFKN